MDSQHALWHVPGVVSSHVRGAVWGGGGMREEFDGEVRNEEERVRCEKRLAGEKDDSEKEHV